jgi:hypothetical protein
MNFVASVFMQTYNRSWAQAGVAGNYAVYSANQENGYAYFVGASTTTGVPLNRMQNIQHSFTRIDLVGVQGDVLSLFKVKVKSTTAFSNPLAGFTKNPAILIASGSFVLPSNATVPFADIIVAGAGGAAGSGHGATHGGGGGGGGGNVISLTDYSIFGSTIVSVGFAGTGARVTRGSSGGQSSFGPVYALGGGGGGGWEIRDGFGSSSLIGNGGGGGAGGSNSGGIGQTQTATTGIGSVGSPQFFGGTNGGSGNSGTGVNSRGGGGGGATASGTNGGNPSGGNGGAGHTSTITGTSTTFGAGGYGSDPNGGSGSGWSQPAYACGGQGTTNGHSSDTVVANSGQNGVVIVRFYTP